MQRHHYHQSATPIYQISMTILIRRAQFLHLNQTTIILPVTPICELFLEIAKNLINHRSEYDERMLNSHVDRLFCFMSIYCRNSRVFSIQFIKTYIPLFLFLRKSSKRSGITTNPAVRLLRNRFDSAAQLIRRTNNMLTSSSSYNNQEGSSSIAIKSGTFQWRKESQM